VDMDLKPGMVQNFLFPGSGCNVWSEPAGKHMLYGHHHDHGRIQQRFGYLKAAETGRYAGTRCGPKVQGFYNTVFRIYKKQGFVAILISIKRGGLIILTGGVLTPPCPTPLWDGLQAGLRGNLFFLQKE
jgi:hypothetical protein